jgi:hypothetical protein
MPKKATGTHNNKTMPMAIQPAVFSLMACSMVQTIRVGPESGLKGIAP